MRTLVLFLLGSALFGASSVAFVGLPTQRVHDLAAGIFDDVGAILESFAGGPNDPRSPVTNAATLHQDSERLDAATRKAEQLAIELSKVKNQADQLGH